MNSNFSDGTKHKYGRRAFLPAKANSLWRIESGVVRTVTWLEDGTTVTLGIWGSGDLVGRALSRVDPYQIESLTIVEASHLPPGKWYLDQELVLNHIQQIEEFMLIRSCSRVDEMLLKLFTWLAKRFGKQVEQGQLISIRLTHQDLADLIGTTRVTVTRIIKQLEDNGIIQRMPKHLTIVQAEEFWHYEI